MCHLSDSDKWCEISEEENPVEVRQKVQELVLKEWAEGRGADAPEVDWEVTVSEPSSGLSSQRRLPEDRVTPAPFCSSLGT